MSSINNKINLSQIATTSIVAGLAILNTSFTEANAQTKPQKMQIGIGGTMTTLVGFAKQNSSFESTASSTTGTGYDSFNILTDTELHFTGTTNLENGLEVSVVIEVEADQVNGGNSIDDSFVALSGNFGYVTVGTHDHASKALANHAPSVGAIPFDDDDADNWVVKPSASGISSPFTDIGGGTDMKISFISPDFNGITFGASFVPSDATSDSMPAVGGTSGTDNQIYDAAISYTQESKDFRFGADIGYWEQHGVSTASFKGVRVGAALDIQNFGIGVAYKTIDDLDTISTGTIVSNEEESWEAGVSYGQGDWMLSTSFISVKRPMSSGTAGDDEVTRLALGGSYKMGPGIDLLGTLIRSDWKDETSSDANNNDGWAAIGGIAIEF